VSRNPQVESFFHPETGSWSHVAWDVRTRAGVIVDPVLDYDAASGRCSVDTVSKLADFVGREDIRAEWILETHAHADHLSGAAWLTRQLGAPVAIGCGIQAVQRHFRDIFDMGRGWPADGSQFDRLFAGGDRSPLGELELLVMRTPGHTDDSVTYVLGDAAFIGDTLFAPDYGTARCDFPGGDARELYRSIRQIFALGDDTRLYLCHDYPPGDRAPVPVSTVAEQRAANIHVHDGIDEDAFVALREERDAGLPVPALILPAIQVNIRAGRLPEPAANGRRYLKIPLDTL
jgi:glyoxylase-like metal-dependent hydrolase (beta-lactamase superfamily II)